MPVEPKVCGICHLEGHDSRNCPDIEDEHTTPLRAAQLLHKLQDMGVIVRGARL